MRVFLVAVAFGVILHLIISLMSYDDEIKDAEMYCDMVEKGVWPDFKGIYEEVCQ